MPSQSTDTPYDKAVICDTDYKPLVDNETPEEGAIVNEEQFNSFKASSRAAGLIFGVVIQFYTLGLNYMTKVLYSIDLLSKDVMVVSIAWSAVTMAIAPIVMAAIRSLVADSFNGSEESLEKLILHMEYRFVSGSLIGVCMAWTVTDISLGHKEQCWQSLLLLAAALSICRIMMQCFLALSKEEKKRAEHYEHPMIV